MLKNLRLLVLLAVVVVVAVVESCCVVVGRVDEEFSERVVVDTPSVVELTLLPPPLVLLPALMVGQFVLRRPTLL